MSTHLQAVVTRHWNDRARSYLRNHSRLFKDRAAAERWRSQVARVLGPGKNLRVLDAGCGPATLTRTLVELGHRVTAVDVSLEMLTRAKDVLRSKASEVDFLEADACYLPLPSEHFDLVVSRYVLWTLPDPSRGVREWKRVLKPGGRLVVIDGNWYYHYYRRGWAKFWLRLVDLGYKFRNGFDRSQKMATHYVANLPATHVLRPHWDAGLLAGAGLVDIQVRRDAGAVVNGFSWQRFSTLFARPFLIEAEKGLEG